MTEPETASVIAFPEQPEAYWAKKLQELILDHSGTRRLTDIQWELLVPDPHGGRRTPEDGFVWELGIAIAALDLLTMPPNTAVEAATDADDMRSLAIAALDLIRAMNASQREKREQEQCTHG